MTNVARGGGQRNEQILMHRGDRPGAKTRPRPASAVQRLSIL
jgi:hypothetical protein